MAAHILLDAPIRLPPELLAIIDEYVAYNDKGAHRLKYEKVMLQLQAATKHLASALEHLWRRGVILRDMNRFVCKTYPSWEMRYAIKSRLYAGKPRWELLVQFD